MFGDVFKEKEKIKRKLAPVTAAEIGRVLASQEETKPAFRKENLWLSSIYYLTPVDFVLDYWRPVARKQTWSMDLHCGIGDFVHQYIQEKLHSAGVLLPQTSGRYNEIRISDPKYRFGGRIDGLIAKDYIKALGATTPKAIPDSFGDLLHLEIKTMTPDKFSETKTAEDISPAYKSQASITQRIIGKEGTLFLLVDKGTPTKMRTLWYQGEDIYWNAAVNLSKTVFSAIENKTLPLVDGSEEELLGMSFAQWLEETEQQKQEWEKW